MTTQPAISTASPLSISSLEACATFHSTDDRARPGCQTFAAERCKLLLITSTQISSIHPQYGPSLRTRIVIISRHVRSRGVDELKMLLLMPQKFNIPTLKIRPSILSSSTPRLRTCRLMMTILVRKLGPYWALVVDKVTVTSSTQNP